MKSLRVLIATLVGAMALAGCGDGGIQSPDFTPVLTALEISPPASTETDPNDPTQYLAPIGLEIPLTAIGTFTAPPGSSPDTFTSPTDASFEVSDPSVATVSDDGVLVGVKVGTVTVTAEKSGVTSNTLTFRVTPAELTGISISPSTASIPAGSTQTFNAVGQYTDGVERPVSVAWSVSPAAGVVTIDPTTGSSTTATAGAAVAPGTTATLTATTTDGSNFTATADITVDNRTVTGLSPDATCTPNPVGIGFTSTCTATATLSDGSTMEASGLVTWSSGTPGVATIDPSTGLATGVAGGSSLITATLNDPAITTGNTATTTLTVLSSANAFCTSPLVTPAAVTTSTFSQTCLACAINNPANVIDDDAATFGSIDTTLALLNGTATLGVNAVPSSTSFPATDAAPVSTGFIVAQPAGMLLSAEVLSTLTVSTIDSSGNVIESGGPTAQPGSPVPQLPVTVTLLGMVGGQDAALVTVEATQPYNGISLTFDSGLVTLLPSINVFQACATANPDALTP